MNKYAAQLLAWVLLGSAGTSAWAQTENCKFSSDRTANFNGPVKKVVVSAAAGDLKIRGDASGGVTATGRACASSESLLGKIALESRRENDIVYLTVVMAEGMGDMFSFNRYASLDLDISVPREAELEVSDSSGDLELSDVGAAKVDDSSGDQLLKNINGNLIVNDSSGEIRVVSVVGNLEVEDSSGNIDIEDVRGDVTIKTDSSGDIAIAKVAGNAEVVNDSSGDITIRDVKKNVTIDNDSSGDINVSDVGGNFAVRADSSGNILHERVGGSVRIPART
ncbi:hypothetical protein GCM10011487_29080 [Steroidobacter agaridevorans]|uniref:DUF4097 domain-containing protein n=1 Tax=Steroidobacter agaridevorans TaxID=2695856 RepID=A0A829YDJ8_9GAMM|nr:DUF4097 family beta strand repeat-containing protein [Steroidobacter agaridevorans]GFE80908.1 hypothetical protein GCM10011487_29080 [Steroidobacter agaridevorans]